MRHNTVKIPADFLSLFLLLVIFQETIFPSAQLVHAQQVSEWTNWEIQSVPFPFVIVAKCVYYKISCWKVPFAMLHSVYDTARAQKYILTL